MFIAVRKYRVRRGAAAEWTKRVQDSFVPLMEFARGMPEVMVGNILIAEVK
jgi:hypothetical protein